MRAAMLLLVVLLMVMLGASAVTLDGIELTPQKSKLLSCPYGKVLRFAPSMEPPLNHDVQRCRNNFNTARTLCAT